MKKIRSTLYIVLASVIFLACKRDDVDKRGPDLAIASSSFRFVTPFYADDTEVDFVTDSIVFYAAFNENVTWTITISGKTTLAEKKITGTSSFINISNAVWDGAHDGNYFFSTGDDVVAELSIFGIDKTWDFEISILRGKKYDGTIISDFEGNGLVSAFSSWWKFFDDNEEVLFDDVNTTSPVQNNYLSVYGQDGLGSSNSYVGGFSHGKVSGGFGLSGSLVDNYFTFYARPVNGEAQVTVRLFEQVAAQNQTQDQNQDKYEYVIVLTEQSWQQVSFNLADATFIPGPSGDGVKDITAIGKIEFILNTGAVEEVFAGVDLDFFVFTKGGPFVP